MNPEVRLIERLALACARGSRQEYFIKTLLKGPVEIRYQPVGWSFLPLHVVTDKNYSLGQFHELRKRMRELGFTIPTKNKYMTLVYTDRARNYRHEFDGI